MIRQAAGTGDFPYYDAGRLDVVTDAASRLLYFSYGTGAYLYLVTSVTSDPAANIIYSYAYDTATPPKLIKITPKSDRRSGSC